MGLLDSKLMDQIAETGKLPTLDTNITIENESLVKLVFGVVLAGMFLMAFRKYAIR